MKRMVLAAVVALGVAGCSETFPIVVMGKDVPGGTMRGQGEASLVGGTFQVSNSQFNCTGNYNAMDDSPTLAIPLVCSDGRRGMVMATRQRGGRSGGGTFTLSDGATGQFMFGDAARGL